MSEVGVGRLKDGQQVGQRAKPFDDVQCILLELRIGAEPTATMADGG